MLWRVVSVVLVLAAGLWVALRPTSDGSDVVVASLAPDEAAEAGVPAEPPGVTPPPAPDTVASSGSAAAVREPVAASEPAPEAGESATVTGTVVVRSRDGEVRADASGRLEFDVEGESGRRQITVAFGRWSMRVPRGRTIRPDQIELDRRLTFLVEREEVLVDRDLELALEAVWPPGALLHVLDAASRVPLNGVTVLRADRSNFYGAVRPPLGRMGLETLAEGARSPVELPRRTWGRSVLWVGATEYAWRRLAVDATSDGDRQVLLPRGGALRVRIVYPIGAGPEPLALRLRAPDETEGPPPFDTPLASGAVEVDVDGLPPRHYAVTVEAGAPDAAPYRLGRTDTVVAVGRRTEVLVTVGADEDAVAPLAGTLSLPPEWDSAGARVPRRTLRLERVGEEEVRARRTAELAVDALPVFDADRGLRGFDAGRLAPGTYTWGVTGTGFEGRVELAPAGRMDARLVVPPPVRLTMRFVAADSGAPVPVRSLVWRLVLPLGDGDTIGAHEIVQADPPRATHVVRVPPGRLYVSVFPHGGYGGLSRHLWIERGAGERTETLELQPFRRLEVRLRCGEASVPLEGSVVVRIERVGGGGAPGMSSGDDVGKTYFLETPGRYVVDVGRVPGFLDPAPVEVHVDGETTELVVDLVAE